MTDTLSSAQARRIALAAQGFTRARPSSVAARHVHRVMDRLGVLQIDSVNVFERSHYLPLFSRLGPYDKTLLDTMLHHDVAATRLGSYTEYTAHEATILPVADWPLWAWHRQRPGRPRDEAWRAAQARLFDEVRAEFADRGALRVRDLEHPQNVSLGGGWWNKNEVHWVANDLFRRGELVVVGRQRFERVLALADRALPTDALTAVPRDEAIVELIRRASRAHGVATLDDLADYPRLKLATARAAVDRLVADGELEPVAVEGWGREAWLASGVRVPRAVESVALLSPFDPLVWHRPRAERLFNFRYRISIYTPAAQREHGYYVLPVLVDDELVGRIDLKSDRKAGVLRVQHATIEPGSAARAADLARRVAPVLEEAASWQGLQEVLVAGTGTWARDLAKAL